MHFSALEKESPKSLAERRTVKDVSAGFQIARDF
jgi:hypothetical protein